MNYEECCIIFENILSCTKYYNIKDLDLFLKIKILHEV